MAVYTLTIYDLFERNATLFPDREALVFQDEATTFKELLFKINNLAGTLKTKGIRKGDRIAILSLNRPEFFIILGAIAKLGAIVVPINWRLSAKEIGYILHDTTPRFLFINSDYQEMVSSLLTNNRYPSEVILFEETGKEKFVPFKQFLKDQELEEETEVEGNSPIFIVHTAAVTGKPLGAVLTHANIIASNMQYMYLMRLTEEDVYLNTLPLYHMAGLTLALAVLHVGGKNAVIPRFDPHDTLNAIAKERVSIMGSFPPILTGLLDAMAKTDYDISSLKHLRGIETLDTICKFKKKGSVEFWAAYGQTETTSAVAICPYFERQGSAGKSSPMSKVRIVDEYDQPVGKNISGEIVVRGPLVFRGYWNEPEITGQTLRGGWLHTGDIGRVDEQGYLWFIKRKAEKELIKSGGENVYPKEVEEAIKQHPRVKEVVVVGVRDKGWGEAVKAVCVLSPGEAIKVHELTDFLVDKIARYKRPKYVEFVDSLPTLRDGRLDREKIQVLYAN
jgi:acyl-CoA synthetase (AMP-forming)/AMP-acid ligase II